MYCIGSSFLRTQDPVSSYPYGSPATESGSVALEVVLSLDRIVASTVLQNIALAHTKGCHAESCVVRPLTGERVARKGPSAEPCEGEVACAKERHSLGCEA